MRIPQLLYYPLAEEVIAFSSTRHGGVSEGNYGEFNINAYCGDKPQHIAENRRALSALLGISEERIIMPHQVPGLCIGVSTADCIPILLYDARHHAACAVHAGWRGTVKRILHRAVAAMTDAYGCIPSEMKAVIGPGISLENFEVGDEVYEQFADAGFEMGVLARKCSKWHIDLPLCNRLQLETLGVKDIMTSTICTYKDFSHYFSARRLGVQSGRVFSGIMLRY